MSYSPTISTLNSYMLLLLISGKQNINLLIPFHSYLFVFWTNYRNVVANGCT